MPAWFSTWNEINICLEEMAQLCAPEHATFSDFNNEEQGD
jgi:hypothetical protein